MQNDVMPLCPPILNEIDTVRACFTVEFLSPCVLTPSEFTRLGRLLKISGRHLVDSKKSFSLEAWQSLFEPLPSPDPVARKKFQKPSPAFVMSIPFNREVSLDIGDRLHLEILFLGDGVPSIPFFLRSLIHVGQLGLAKGEGRFDVSHFSCLSGTKSMKSWCAGQSIEKIACQIEPLSWLITPEKAFKSVRIVFQTPARLMVSGRPLRAPTFLQLFPFMLRRVTSMLHAHSHVEFVDDSGFFLEAAEMVNVDSVNYSWCDWRKVRTNKDADIGGFLGDIVVSGEGLEDIFWVLAAASLFGIGKGASLGSGRFDLEI